MNNQPIKLENPVRIHELNPEETLRRIGLQDGDVFCDIGAGTGVFTVPAATLTQNTVYALEINPELLPVIQNKAADRGLGNIQVKLVSGDSFGLNDGSVDITLMCTVLHEIGDKRAFLHNVKKLLKAGGRAAVIEFHKRSTPMGPPAAHRIGREEVSAEMQKAGLRLAGEFDLGENFYCMVFENQ